ncbi:RTA1 like protein-domain-containing protein [Amylocarpus encephaloides]|uniref:RTA1 like protein-domain-containing protein n=1 Tax=Amylocarpus encephaloides TaxID=45428 RepID=A0A9P8C096_9HELO|nr:RTA1 like protein-domain-containing protein [Amylocarpus encephaloides]
MAEGEHDFGVWNYLPSVAAAVIFVILFSGSTIFHCFQIFKKKSFFFVPFALGGYFEVGGYITRILAHDDTENQLIYIMQIILLLVAPGLYAASIYMTLGRIIIYTNALHLSPIKRVLLTKIFVTGDVVSFFVQLGGASLMSEAKTQATGKTIVLIGLGVQVVFFLVFLFTALVFHSRLRKNPTAESVTSPWIKHMYALYFASLLISIRSIFRVAEFSGGKNGSLMTHEVYLYIFDSVLMFGVSMCFNVVHPGDMIGRKSSGYEESVSLA